MVRGRLTVRSGDLTVGDRRFRHRFFLRGDVPRTESNRGLTGRRDLPRVQRWHMGANVEPDVRFLLLDGSPRCVVDSIRFGFAQAEGGIPTRTSDGPCIEFNHRCIPGFGRTICRFFFG